MPDEFFYIGRNLSAGLTQEIESCLRYLV